jgi:hypothetical protein
MKRPQKIKENNRCGNVIYFELFGEKCMTIMTTGQISFQNNQVNLYEFFFLGT